VRYVQLPLRRITAHHYVIHRQGVRKYSMSYSLNELESVSEKLHESIEEACPETSEEKTMCFLKTMDVLLIMAAIAVAAATVAIALRAHRIRCRMGEAKS